MKTRSKKRGRNNRSTRKKRNEKSGNSSTKRGSRLSPKARAAIKKAAACLWDIGVPPHTLLQELHEVLLLRCLEEAEGNYAAAASLFGPSRQSVQQYANSPLRDGRWKSYQQNQRKRR